MEELTYKIDEFEGPLDLLLSLIQKNKVNISDIPIALIFDQYMEYIHAAEKMNMEIASEFIVMASELMLIKSKMLLPRENVGGEDPRTPIAELLLRYQQAKQGALKMAPLFAFYSARMVKDTDEISPDKSFVADDQDPMAIVAAIRRVAAEYGTRPKENSETFTPMIASPIIPVELKIVGILKRINKTGSSTLKQLLDDSVSLPDMIAVFLGVLELMKMRQIVLVETETPTGIYGTDVTFTIPDETRETENTSADEVKEPYNND